MKVIMKLLSMLLIQLAATTISFGESDIEDRHITMDLEYSSDLSPHPEFVRRSPILLTNLRSGAQQFDSVMFDGERGKLLDSLASEGGIYRLKAHTSIAAVPFQTYLPTSSICHNFDEKLMLQLDPFNRLVAVSYAPLKKPCSAKAHLSRGIQVGVDLVINYVEQGPQPETASYIQRMEQEKASRETGEVKDNRSFFAKYWMYIIPVVIFVMMSGASGGAEQSR